MKRTPAALLHMKDAIEKIETYISTNHADFLSNTMEQDAIVR